MPTPSSQLPDPVRGPDAVRRAALRTRALGHRTPQLIALERALSRPGAPWMRHPPGWLAALQPRIKAQWDAGRGAVFKRLLQYVVRMAPGLIEEPFTTGLFGLSELPWVRPLAEWTGWVDGGSARQFRSLAEHLVARWPLPPVLLDTLTDDGLRHLGLLRHVASGGSLRRVAGTALLPVPLTRAQVHALSTDPPAGECWEEVVRRVQLRALAPPAWLVEAIVASRLGEQLVEPAEERRWQQVFRWLVANAEALDPEGAAQILAFLHDEPLPVRGRSPARLLALARAWEPAPTHAGPLPARPATPYRPSGIRSLHAEFAGSLWTVSEVRSWRALFWEGRKMRHCVSMYASRVKAGQCSIWSLRRDGARVLTVEVRNQRRNVVQIRGHCNRRATDAERAVLATWARRAGLSL